MTVTLPLQLSDTRFVAVLAAPEASQEEKVKRHGCKYELLLVHSVF